MSNNSDLLLISRASFFCCDDVQPGEVKGKDLTVMQRIIIHKSLNLSKAVFWINVYRYCLYLYTDHMNYIIIIIIHFICTALLKLSKTLYIKNHKVQDENKINAQKYTKEKQCTV